MLILLDSQNTAKEGNTQMYDKSLLKEEEVGLNKTSFVNSVYIHEDFEFGIFEKTDDSQVYSCGTIHEISKDSGSTATLSEFEEYYFDLSRVY